MLFSLINEKLSEFASRRGFVWRIARAAGAIGAALVLRSPVASALFPASCCELCKPNAHQQCSGCGCSWYWLCNNTMGDSVTCQECFPVHCPCDCFSPTCGCCATAICSSACYTGEESDCWPS
jgi:hypothetical protein